MGRWRDRLTRKRHDVISLQAMEAAGLHLTRLCLKTRYTAEKENIRAGRDIDSLPWVFFESDYYLLGLRDELEILTFMRVYTQHGEQLTRGRSERLEVHYRPHADGHHRVVNTLVVDDRMPARFAIETEEMAQQGLCAPITEKPLPEKESPLESVISQMQSLHDKTGVSTFLLIEGPSRKKKIAQAHEYLREQIRNRNTQKGM